MLTTSRDPFDTEVYTFGPSTLKSPSLARSTSFPSTRVFSTRALSAMDAQYPVYHHHRAQFLTVSALGSISLITPDQNIVQ